jgi:penicillin-binding protein 2
MVMIRRIFLPFVLCFLVFTSANCSSNDDSGGLLGLNSGPTAVVSLDTGDQTATTFLDAWTRQDYNTMYGLISPNARDAYPQEEFTAIYQGVWEDLRLQGISWERGNSVLQGTTDVFEYSVTFRSSVLGEFSDPERIMRIIPTDEGMRIAWSRMDIFDGWAGGARLQVERFLAGRGNIYDRNGRALADQNGVALPIYVVKNDMAGVEQCINELVLVLGREYNDLLTLFNSYNFDTLFLVGEIDPETYRERGGLIEEACHPQIGERPTRRYFASAAPHVIGYVGQIPAEQAAEYDSRGYPADALVGVAGIEQAWERELRGTVGNRLSLFSVTDDRLRVITEKQATPGESVYLTLDRELQAGITEALASAYSFAEPTWGRTSPGAAVVVMDVNTGAILAIASYPSFDPAVFSPDSPYLDPAAVIQEYNTDLRRPLLNRATQGRYPLGSVFKLVSSTAGADSGLVPFDNLNNCTGTWYGEQYGDITRTDWLRTGHGVLDGRGAIIQSCNPYYWQLSVTLNNTDPFLLPNYARMYGFGSRTGLRGVIEDEGTVPDPDWKAQQGFTWAQPDASNLVIGQGELAVTPLQVVRMVAAIANGGKLLTPYLVEKVQLIGEDPSFQATPEFEQLPINPDVLAEIREAMCNVTTTPSGTANFIYQDWYEYQNFAVVVCGKTGTAQAGNNQPHAWFAAFAPADDPEIAIAVIVENSCEGSEVAAPITRRILEIYYGLPEYGWPDPIWRGACSEIVIE